MAEDQKKVTSSLKNIESSIKTFGPKKPSGKNIDNNEIEINSKTPYVDIICGALGAFIYGQKLTKNDRLTQLNTLLNSGKPLIFDNINQIKKALVSSSSQRNIPGLLRSIDSTLKTLLNNNTGGENTNQRIFDINVSGVNNEKSIRAFIDLINKVEKSKTNKFDENVLGFLETFKTDGSLQKIIEGINEIQINDTTYSNTNKIIDILRAFGEIHNDKLALTGAKSIDIYVKMAESFVELSKKLGEIDAKAIQQASEAMTDIGLMTVVLTGTLILVGYVGNQLNYVGIAKFLVTLSLFIGSLLFIFSSDLLTKNLHQIKDTLDDVALLVVVCSGILITATLVSDLIKFEKLVSFTLNLTGFISGLFLVLKWIPPTELEKALEGAEDFSLLVLVCGSIMLFAGLISSLIDVRALTMFTVLLSIFIISLSAPLSASKRLVRDSLASANDLALLVASVGATLILGSLFMYIIDEKNLIKFGIVLLGFITIVCLALSLWSIWAKPTFTYLKEFAFLVLSIGGILLFGATFITLFPQVVPGIIKFGALLALSLALIILPLWLFKPTIELSIESATGLAIVIGTLALVLSIGAFIVHGEKAKHALVFAGIISLFMFAMTGVVYLLTKMSDDLGSAILALLGISVMTGIYAVIFYSVIKMNLFSKQKHIWVFLGAATAFTGAFLVLTAAAALASPLVIIGLFSLLLIELTAYSLIQIMKYISDENKNLLFKEIFGDFSAIKNIFTGDVKNLSIGSTIADILEGLSKGFIGKSIAFILGMGAIAGLLSTLLLPLTASIIPIGVLMINVVLLSSAMTLASVSLRELDKAAKINSENIFNTIDAYVSIAAYMVAKFNNPLMIPFVLSSVANVITISGALAAISFTIQSIASFRIPIYAENSTEIKGYREINSSDFIKASNNIKTMIDTLASSIIESYNKSQNKELFESDFWGNSKFGNMAKSLSNMSILIDKISKSVRDYATLKIPVYTGTKITGYRPIKTQDFLDAKFNIEQILETMPKAIMDVYDEKYFSSDWFNITDSPFTSMIKQLSKMANLISTISNAVKNYACLQVPVVDNNNHIIKDTFRPIDETDFTNAQTNIGKILTLLPKTIIDVYNGKFPDGKGNLFHAIGYENMFDDDWFTDSPFTKVTKQLSRLGSLISDISTGIVAYATSQVPVYDKDNKIKEGEFQNLNDGVVQNAIERIKSIITLVPAALIDAYNTHPEFYSLHASMGKDIGGWFTTHDWWNFFGLGDTPLEKVIGHNILIGQMLVNLSQGLKDFAELRVPNFGQDGQITGYRALNGTYEPGANPGDKPTVTGDYEKIYNNIQGIVSIFVDSFIHLADKDIFDGGLLKDSKAMNIIKTITEMGNAISSIALGIQAYANLKIPIYNTNDPTNLNPTGYVDLSSNKEIFPQMRRNIRNIIGVVVSALNDLSNDAFIINDNGTTKIIDLKKIFEDDTIVDICTALATSSTQLINVIEQFSTLNQKLSESNLNDDTVSSLSNKLKNFGILLFGEDKSLFETLAGNVSNGSLLYILKSLYNFKKVNNIDNANLNFSEIATGIDKVIKAIENIKGTQNIQKWAEHTGKFARSINSIDAAKLTEIRGIADDIAKLGETEKIQSLLEITQTFYTAVKSLEASIDDANKLSDKRKNQVKENVNEIKKLLEKEMTVILKPEEQPTTNTTTTGGFSSTPSTDERPAGQFSQGSIGVTQTTGKQVSSKLETDISNLIIAINKLVKTLDKDNN